MAGPTAGSMAGSVAFDGAVLAGGASRRMGCDKAHIVVDGRPLHRRATTALAAAGAATVVVVGGDATRFGPDLVHVADRWPGLGPLGGVITALDGPGREAAVVVVSCDLVDPDPGAIGALVTALAAGDHDVAVAVADDRDQWTHAAWSRRVADVLEERFTAGTRSVHAAVVGLDVVRVPVTARAVADADRPEDLP